MAEYQGTFSVLQHLLQSAYSDDPELQQKAAIELARLVDGTPFPAVSFGPLSHALCKLIPSKNRTVASYAARALKMLILDDALRPQIATIVPPIICEAINYWEDEVLCLREFLAVLQTLCWDKTCLKAVLSCSKDVITCIIDNAKSSDTEVAVLSLATLANITSFVDTSVLIGESAYIAALGEGMVSPLLEILKGSPHRPQRFYAAACVANACAHPMLADIVQRNGGLKLMQEVETKSLANLHILGSRLGDCAHTAIERLSEGNGRDVESGMKSSAAAKYSFKWGTKPVMELSLLSVFTSEGNGAADKAQQSRQTKLMMLIILNVSYAGMPFSSLAVSSVWWLAFIIFYRQSSGGPFALVAWFL